MHLKPKFYRFFGWLFLSIGLLLLVCGVASFDSIRSHGWDNVVFLLVIGALLLILGVLWSRYPNDAA